MSLNILMERRSHVASERAGRRASACAAVRACPTTVTQSPCTHTCVDLKIGDGIVASSNRANRSTGVLVTNQYKSTEFRFLQISSVPSLGSFRSAQRTRSFSPFFMFSRTKKNLNWPAEQPTSSWLSC